MSSIYVFKTEIFPYDEEAPFRYLLHTLFLQNIEKIILLQEDPSDFFNYVNFLLVSDEIPEEYEEILKSFAKNSVFIKQILKKALFLLD